MEKQTDIEQKQQPCNEPFDWGKYWETKGQRRISSHRPHAVWCNYKWCGVFLITIVTRQRKPMLGRLNNDPQNPQVELTNIGQFVLQEWMSTPAKQAQHGRHISLLAQQVMPDHFHGVLRVEKELDVSIGAIIRDFKAQCTKEWRRLYQPLLADTLESAETKAALARMSRKQREAFYQEQGAESLFDDNYDDTICFREGQTENAVRYVLDNPRRLALKRANPQLFKLHQRVRVAGFECTTLGNQFLLDFPMKEMLQCSRRLTQADIDQKKEQCLMEAEQGTVFVSAGISEGEKQICRALREAGFSMIILLKDGFPKETDPNYQYFKPQGAYFETCAEGRLLLIEPSEELYDNQDIETQVYSKAGVLPHDTLRYRFLALNAMIQMINNCKHNS